MDTLKSNKSAFSIDNILEQKYTNKLMPISVTTSLPMTDTSLATTSPVYSAKTLPSPSNETINSSNLTPKSDSKQYTAFKDLTLKTNSHSPVTSNTATSLPLLSHNSTNTAPAAPPLPALHFDHVYDPTASLFYQQVLNLQKNSAFLMPHFQVAAAAAAAVAARGTPSVYCETPYNQFMDCEGE